MGTLAKSEDPDEMPHNVAFHQGLHYLQIKKMIWGKLQFICGNYKLWPLDIYNGPNPGLLYQIRKKSPLVCKGLILQSVSLSNGHTHLFSTL